MKRRGVGSERGGSRGVRGVGKGETGGGRGGRGERTRVRVK